MKSYDQPRQHSKKQRHYFANKGPSSQTVVFPVVMYGCESWTIKKAERRRIDAFELWCWRRLLRVPWTARRSNQSILKEISPGCSLEGLMLKLKLQYIGHLMQGAYSNSCPLSWWCHPIISSSNESVLHIRSQSIRVSTSASVLPMNIQDWFPLGLTGWISLQSNRCSKVFCNTTVQKHQFFGIQLS